MAKIHGSVSTMLIRMLLEVSTRHWICGKSIIILSQMSPEFVKIVKVLFHEWYGDILLLLSIVHAYHVLLLYYYYIIYTVVHMMTFSCTYRDICENTIVNFHTISMSCKNLPQQSCQLHKIKSSKILWMKILVS